MSNDILFDNFIITDNKRVADLWAADSWQLKNSEESAATVSPVLLLYTCWARKKLSSECMHLVHFMTQDTVCTF